MDAPGRLSDACREGGRHAHCYDGRMSRWILRAAIVLVVALGPVLVVVLRHGRTPQPPALPDPAGLDPLVARLVEEMVGLVRSRPRDADAWARLAMVCHAHQIIDAAERCYRQTLRLDRGDAPSWYNLARVLAHQGAFDEALDGLDRAIALEPGYAPLYCQRGEWLLQLGRLEPAEAAFRRAAELDRAGVAAICGLARVRLQQRRYKDAAALLVPLVVADDDAPGERLYVRSLLGRAYRGLGRGDEADRLLAAASSSGPTLLAPAPDDPWARRVDLVKTGYAPELLRAEAMIQAGQAAATIPRLREVVATYGPDRHALNVLAGAYAAAGRRDDAIRTLRELLEHDPVYVTGHLNLATQLERTGDLDRALAAVRSALAVEPRPDALATEARLLARRGDLPGAVIAYERALAAGADAPEHRLAFAHVLDRTGRPQEAVRLYRELLDEHPALAAAHAGLASALAALSEFDEARRALWRARQLAPDDPFVTQSARRVDALERGGP